MRFSLSSIPGFNAARNLVSSGRDSVKKSTASITNAAHRAMQEVFRPKKRQSPYSGVAAEVQTLSTRLTLSAVGVEAVAPVSGVTMDIPADTCDEAETPSHNEDCVPLMNVPQKVGTPLRLSNSPTQAEMDRMATLIDFTAFESNVDADVSLPTTTKAKTAIEVMEDEARDNFFESFSMDLDVLPKPEIPLPLNEEDVPLPRDAQSKESAPIEKPVEKKEDTEPIMDEDMVDDIFQSIDRLMQQMDDEHEPIRRPRSRP